MRWKAAKFTVGNYASTSLAPGASTTFSIAVNTNNVDVIDSAQISILSDDADPSQQNYQDDEVLNNSSVGVYPRIVKLREEHAARGVGKWAVAAWATMPLPKKVRGRCLVRSMNWSGSTASSGAISSFSDPTADRDTKP